MSWIILILAGLCEVGFAFCLGKTKGLEGLPYWECMAGFAVLYKLIDGRRMQCFTPRKRNSPWTELNKERVRRLERLGLMTDAGRKVLLSMGVRSFKIDKDVEAALKSARAWTKYKSFPPLYQRIRAYNVAFYKTRDKGMYEQTLLHLITETKAGRMFGEWNDYGRLLDS